MREGLGSREALKKNEKRNFGLLGSIDIGGNEKGGLEDAGERS